MWKIKTFKTSDALFAWILENGETHQYQEIFVNNGYGVEYKPLRVIDLI